MGSNRGNHVKHAPGYVCHKAGNPKKTEEKKAEKRKRIASDKLRAKVLAEQ